MVRARTDCRPWPGASRRGRPRRGLGRVLRRPLRRQPHRRAGVAHCRDHDPPRGHRPAGRGRDRRGAPARGCSGSPPRRCRWASRLSPRRSPTLASRPRTSGCSPSRRAPATRRPASTSCWPGTSAWATTVQRLHIGHMGCYAALPGLGAVSDFVVARGRPAVLLCLELDQPARAAGDRRRRADGGARAVRRRGRGRRRRSGRRTTATRDRGLDVIDITARTDVGAVDHMTWDITDLGFRMGLSPKVPDVLAATSSR